MARTGVTAGRSPAHSPNVPVDPQPLRVVWRHHSKAGGEDAGGAWSVGLEVKGEERRPASGALYDPRSNRWRRLPKGPLGVREQYASVWTGPAVIFGGHGGDTFATPTAAALNPRTRSWRKLRALDSIIGLGTVNGALWNGREAL